MECYLGLCTLIKLLWFYGNYNVSFTVLELNICVVNITLVPYFNSRLYRVWQSL